MFQLTFNSHRYWQVIRKFGRKKGMICVTRRGREVWSRQTGKGKRRWEISRTGKRAGKMDKMQRHRGKREEPGMKTPTAKGGMRCCVDPLPPCYLLPFDLQTDEKMNEVMDLAHTFLQNFCRGNPQNQVLLHKHLNLFLTPGVSTTVGSWHLQWMVRQIHRSANGILLTFVQRCHSTKLSVSTEEIL